MELGDAVRRRRMVRNFTDEPVAPEVVDALLDLARRAPSAGNSQGWHFLVLEGPEQTSRFWDVTLPPERRDGFRWPGLLRAPVIVLPMADAGAYVARYAEDDKARTGLGASEDAWPVPYWVVDTAFATMTLLHAVVDAGLGALFFGIFREEERLLRSLGVPEGIRPIGAVAIGHPAPDEPGRSAARPRRPADQVVHRGGW
ncbi:nitroreductase family protein [Actinomarinicola tropica]|uniref:Nitroreductase family protein n=1 Tax=Actinomarinicola tropica TaxID=2789776 RepID=A0A5Q2RFC5_9ACTN|nr:nitroreductase family protein [Actinomarinicola tropica]QGG95529.1 nitroreductase family protein [Actinomarinicola tropica]